MWQPGQEGSSGENGTYICMAESLCRAAEIIRTLLSGYVLSHFGRVWLSVTLWTLPTRLLCPRGTPGKNTEVGCPALFQWIYPTQGLNTHLLLLLHCRQILYHWVPWEVQEGAMCCAALFAQSCPTLCDPVDWSPPGSSVRGDSPGKNTGVCCHIPIQNWVLLKKTYHKEITKIMDRKRTRESRR